MHLNKAELYSDAKRSNFLDKNVNVLFKAPQRTASYSTWHKKKASQGLIM